MTAQQGKVRLGIVGVGEIAQIVHLPNLETLSDYFEVAAICDISTELMDVVGERYNVARRYRDVGDLAEQSDLDAVLVLNSPEYHTAATAAALRSGKDVLVEKPMCFTHREADEIVRARDESGGQVMVGYMRRYAPAFLRAVDEVRSFEQISFARFRDIIGPNRWYTDQTVKTFRPDDIPASLMDERKQLGEDLLDDAVGGIPEDLRRLYRLLLGLSSHDTSTMREVVGMPTAVATARCWQANGRFFSVLFEHDGFCTSLETGIDMAGGGHIDMDFEVYGPGRSVQLQFDTPFVRQIPVEVRIRRTEGEEMSENVVRPTYRDPFTCELLEFHKVVTEKKLVKTTPEDYKQDLEVFSMIIDALKANA